ncbi:MAG TPA: SMC-Scp complex subunit ScpB [Burkholderiales bacterium]|nr:SMC-Scp complex subunit ScpB [Burkholderiales bacterium]
MRPTTEHDDTLTAAGLKPDELKIVLETLLFTSAAPVSLNALRAVFGDGLSIEVLRRSLGELAEDWRNRGLELIAVAEGWRFQTRTQYQPYVLRLSRESPPKYSRAVMETLTIIAYKQPVTRGDIEEIRGVGVSTQIIRTLEQRGWIQHSGYRNVPGRPALFVTTPQFLNDLNLRSISELPPLGDSGSRILPNPANQELL